MIKQLTYVIALLAHLSISCNGQKTPEDKLLGNWEIIESDQEIILYFQKGGIVDFEQNGHQYKASYKFTSDTTLLFGSTLYKVIALTDTDLILETGSFSEKYHYRKTAKTIKTIQEYETVSETFSNGKKKVKGKYHNGLADGKWTEWYENGQLKSVQNFTDGIPIGKQEFWYENGQKEEEKEVNSQRQLIYFITWDKEGNIKERKN